MKARDLKIVFLGTPDFAVTSLRALIEEGFNVVGVITAPDKPAGRGLKLKPSPVKEFALERGLTILQPTNLKSPEFLDELKSLDADLQVVIAFRMLPEAVWSMPRLGTFNLHASYLPQYRGAAPINHAIINGEKETGVTTFFLKHQIDTGNIIFQERIPIGENETAGELHDKLMDAGAALVVKTLRAIESGNYEMKPQEESGDLKHAPKIFRDDCQIDWERGLNEIHNHIRGLSPYPAAWTQLNGQTLKILRAEMVEGDSMETPGTIISDNRSFIRVAVRGGFLNLLELQLEGRKLMPVADFLRGFDISRFNNLK